MYTESLQKYVQVSICESISLEVKSKASDISFPNLHRVYFMQSKRSGTPLIVHRAMA